MTAQRGVFRRSARAVAHGCYRLVRPVAWRARDYFTAGLARADAQAAALADLQAELREQRELLLALEERVERLTRENRQLHTTTRILLTVPEDAGDALVADAR